MSAKTEISWTDATWNPTRGCSMAKGSETLGCLNCYAARLASRNLPELNSPITGKPFARILDSGPRWTGVVELIESALTIPLRWKRPRKIFVNSMSDLFHEALSDESIDRAFGVMAACPQHTFQALTKHPRRALVYLSSRAKSIRYWERAARDVGYSLHFDGVDGGQHSLTPFPLPNLWLGVSVEDQKTADERIPVLLQTPAAIRFVSYEPALGAVDFSRYLVSQSVRDNYKQMLAGFPAEAFPLPEHLWLRNGLDQIIVGGESGPGARPFDVHWARETVSQCRKAETACFVKQLGSNPREGNINGSCGNPACTHPDCGYIRLKLKDRKGGDWDEWPKDLRVREFPGGAK